MFKCRWDEGKRIPELDRNLVECTIIYTGPQASVLRRHKEKTRCGRGVGWDDVALFKSFLHILLHGLLFW